MLRKEDGSTETFRHPTDMTDEQFDEFKRAQNNGLSVEVIYNQENHKIESLSVYTEATAVDDDLVISHKNPKKRG